MNNDLLWQILLGWLVVGSFALVWKMSVSGGIFKMLEKSPDGIRSWLIWYVGKILVAPFWLAWELCKLPMRFAVALWKDAPF